MKMLRYYLGSKALEKAVTQTTWKEVWSAGQGVGLIDGILPAAKIVQNLVEEYYEASKLLAVALADHPDRHQSDAEQSSRSKRNGGNSRLIPRNRMGKRGRLDSSGFA